MSRDGDNIDLSFSPLSMWLPVFHVDYVLIGKLLLDKWMLRNGMMPFHLKQRNC